MNEITVDSLIEIENSSLLETRELWWNIDTGIGKIIFYLLALVAVVFFVYGYYQKIKHIFKGKQIAENRFNSFKDRFLSVFNFAFLHKKIKEKKVP